jgi:hypothetical protein
MMAPADQTRYRDIVELAARWFAFAKSGDGTMPRVLTDLIAEAAELSGAWDGFSGDGQPGTADLPGVDAVIDEVIERANALRSCIARVPGPRYRH